MIFTDYHYFHYQQFANFSVKSSLFNIQMKESKYNYCVRYNGKFAFFNGRTKRFFFVSEKTRMMFADILHNPNNYAKEYCSFIDKMKNEGFILEDEDDEYKLFMDEYRRSMSPNVYKLMVLPTYRCNLSCWYCFQDHRHVDMSDETVEKIKKHIYSYLTQNDIKRFHLSWFGGEPLLKYDIVCELTEYAKNICDDLHIIMDSGITTNSLLLTKERIERLKLFNVNYFQITIDGTREEHNKVKVLPNKDTFTMALNNVVDILTIIPDSRVNLRINYSSRTKHPRQIIDEINNLIPTDLRTNIDLDIQKVWQENDDLIGEDPFRELLTYSKKMGFCPSVVHRGKCYVDNYHFNTVFPDGTVDICDHEGLDVIGRAVLNDDGSIHWKEQLPCFKYSIDKENIICNGCRHLPLCYGPCPAKRNEYLSIGALQECPYDDIDEAIERDIVNFININHK